MVDFAFDLVSLEVCLVVWGLLAVHSAVLELACFCWSWPRLVWCGLRSISQDSGAPTARDSHWFDSLILGLTYFGLTWLD